jgi:hypothetical protein
MLYTDGNLSAETYQLRQIARKKIAVALQSIEYKTELLVDDFVKRLTPDTNGICGLMDTTRFERVEKSAST